MRWISRNFLLFAGLGLLIPFVAGFVLHEFSLTAALWTLLWAGFVRIFFIHHVTWSINSICHVFGRRRFEVDGMATRQGLGRWEVDPSAMFIWLLEKLGIARNVVRITPERQAQKLLGARPAGAAKTRAAA